MFTTWIYLYFINYFLKSEIVLDQFPLLLTCSMQFISNSNILFKSFFELFYSLYLLIIYILILIGW
jgi:hypothetical protein